MPKKIKVNSECIGCGMCLVNSYMEELPDGKVQPKGTGILSEKDEATFMKVVNDCPANAISLEGVIAKSKGEIVSEAKKKIEMLKLLKPTKEELKYEEKYADFYVPEYVRGEDRAEYSSYERAKSAAKDAIDQAMYSQRGTIVKSIVNNYCIDKLTPYTRYDETERNFFYSSNKKAEKILAEIAGEFQTLNPAKKIPENMLTIQSRPDSKADWEMKSLKTDILYQADVILGRGMSGEYYKLSSYVQDCDIDSYEVYAGTGLFGRDRYVDKYYFHRTKNAFHEIAKDIQSACTSEFNDAVVEEFALPMTTRLAERYEKRLKDELLKKVDELKNYL